jgi:polar amino acid transport system substrate-binding protein
MNYISFLKERWHIVIALVLLLMAFSASVVLLMQFMELQELSIPMDDSAGKYVYLVGVSDTDYPPLLTWVGDQPTGLDIDLIQWISNEAGIQISFVPIPWENIFDALINKEIDMVMSGVSITPEREEKFLFSDPYLSIEQTIAVVRDSPLTLRDFYTGEKIIGVEAGTTSEGIVHNQFIVPGITDPSKVHVVGGIEQGAKDLMDGKLDYIMTDQPIMAALAQEYPLKIIGSFSTGEEYGIAFRKDSVSLQQTINTGMRTLLQSSD